MSQRHCRGCFRALPAWPPSRCPRCGRPTFVRTIHRAAIGVVLAALVVAGVVALRASQQPPPAAKTPTPAAPASLAN